jgi:predicted acyl esterase
MEPLHRKNDTARNPYQFDRDARERSTSILGDEQVYLSIKSASRATKFESTGLMPTRKGFPVASEKLGSQPTYNVKFEGEVMIPMRDGVHLAADIYRPDANGRWTLHYLWTCDLAVGLTRPYTSTM